jgi:phosphoribosylglycinamide formyltransferase 1
LCAFKTNLMKSVAIFASGGGSNAQKIVEFSREKQSFRVTLIVCNNPNAAVIQKANQWKIPILMCSKEDFGTSIWHEKLQSFSVDWIVLAGFLWKIPDTLIQSFPDRIVNIHPALLPKYGGHGMYGIHVHRAVLANAEIKSGISIHLVNEHYDEGKMLFQAAIAIQDCQTAEEIASKVLQLEHLYFPKVIEALVLECALVQPEPIHEV